MAKTEVGGTPIVVVSPASGVATPAGTTVTLSVNDNVNSLTPHTSSRARHEAGLVIYCSCDTLAAT
jgi:hypothetical protein